jgi:hypothetical protein
MKKMTFLSVCCFLISFNGVIAQNEISKRYEEAVQKCIKQKPNSDLAKDFKMFSWAKTLQGHLAEVKDNKNSDVLFEIAEQREVVNSLLALGNCGALDAKIKNHLQKMQKIYDTSVKDEVKSKNTAKSYNEERTVTMDYASAVRLKIHVNSIVNIMQGDSSIFRILK